MTQKTDSPVQYLIQVSEHEPEYFVFDFPGSHTPVFVYQDMLRDPPPDLSGIDVAIDLGANIGMWSFRMANLYKKVRFIAYEPMPVNIANFLTGLKANELNNIELKSLAVSEDGRDITLLMNPSNSGSASMYNPDIRNFVKEVVKSVSLSDVCAPYNNIALKVDIEGAEFHLFNGFKYWDRIKKIFIEVHPKELAGSKEERMAALGRFVKFLRDKVGPGNVTIGCTDENFRGL